MIFALLLGLGSNELKSQHKKDSLWAIWKNTTLLDTVRLNALDKLCGFQYSTMPDTIIAYTKLGYEFSKKINHKRGIAQALMIRAGAYSVKGDFEKSLLLYHKVLKLFQELHYENGINKCFLNMANCYYKLEDRNTAIKYYYEALNGFTNIRETRPALIIDTKECIGLTLGQLGVVYLETGSKDSALTLMNKSLAIYRETKNKERIIKILHKIGTVYYSNYEPDKAILYHQKAIKLCTDPVFLRELASSYSAMAMAYHSKRNYAVAKKNALKSLKINRQLKDSVSTGLTLNILSNIIHDMGDLKNALKLGRHSFELLKNEHTRPTSVNQAVILAMWYSENKELKKAEEMYDYYFKNRNIGYSNNPKDELFRSQVNYNFNKKQLIAKAELEKKLNNLRFETEQKDARKNLWLISSFFLLVIALLSAWFVYKNFKQKAIIATQKNNILKQQLLVSQMNPHFIFNSLTAIQNFIFKQETYSAGIYLKQFSVLIRMILDFSTKDVISLEDEYHFLVNYLELQKLRFDNKLNYELKIAPEIDKEMTFVPPMLAQPFIENAIEHGIFYKNGNGFLSIKISLDKNTLIYEIEDDGIGLEEAEKLKREVVTKHKSMAIKITKERINALNQENKSNVKIEIKDKHLSMPESTGVYVKFATPYLIL